jgi:hypothetical protein
MAFTNRLDGISRDGVMTIRHLLHLLRKSGAIRKPKATRVKLQSTSRDAISVFELQVFNTSCINIAKTSTQSSTYNGYDASNAVDRDNTTYSRTRVEADAWLDVDLGEIVEVCSIGIQNRCEDANCLCNLSNASLSLIDASGSVIANAHVYLNNTCGQPNVKVHFDPKAAFYQTSVRLFLSLYWKKDSTVIPL